MFKVNFVKCMCIAEACTVIMSIANGIVFGVWPTLGFSCNDGFKLDGSSSTTCNSNGTWSEDAPTCKGMSLDARTTVVFLVIINFMFSSHIYLLIDNNIPAHRR